MYRLTKNYFRLSILVAAGLCIIFLVWQLGSILGSARVSWNSGTLIIQEDKDSTSLKSGSKLRSENNRERAETRIREKSSGDVFVQKKKKSRKKEAPNVTHFNGKKELVENGKKTKKEYPTRISQPKVMTVITSSTSQPTTPPATLPTTPPATPPALSPITFQYSWSEVYGESGCSPNPWRPTLVELFAEWTKIAKKHNIEYVLFYGSLLGALRTGDVIPYDSDIDLLMDVKYFPEMKEISTARGFDVGDGKIRLVVQPEFDHDVPSNSRKRYTCKGKLTPNMVDPCSFQEPLARLVKKQLHIDFYHYYDKGSILEDPSEEDLKTYHKNDMFPLRPCKFMGLDSFCPKKPWKLLKKYFHSDNLESKYKCKNKRWVDGNGKPV